MHIFHNRPLAFSCICLAFVAIGAYSFDGKFSLLFSLILFFAATVSIVFYFLKHHKALFGFALCGFLCAIALLSSHCFFQVRYGQHQALIGQNCEIEGTVIRIDYSKSYSSSFRVKLDRLNESDCMDTVILKCNYSSALKIGDRLVATVVGTDFTNEGGYDEKSYVLSDGVIGVYSCEASEYCDTLESESVSPQILFYKWNNALAFRLEQAIGGDEGRLVNALLLGNRESLSDATKIDFERAGVSHLLALSGLHVSILIGLLDWLLKKLFCPKIIRVVFITVLSITYLFLTGCAPSTVRAVSMLFLMNLGFVLREEYDSFTALCITLAMFLILMPYAVADLGMWMSFIAAAAIIVFLPALNASFERLYDEKKLPNALIKLLSAIASAFFIGIVANVALLLIQAKSFGEYSVLSVPSTLLLSIPLTLTLFGGVFTLLFPILGVATGFFARLMLWITDSMSALNDILFLIDDIFSTLIIFAATISLLFIAIAKLRHVLLWCILPFALSLAAFPVSALITARLYENIQVDCLTESGGDILLFSQNGKSVAFDFSDGTGAGAYLLAESAKAARCTELNDLVISHYHNRDTYFLHRISSLICVRNLRLPIPKNDWEAAVASRLCEEAEFLGISVSFHLEDIALSNLEIQAFDHALFDSGRHAALLLSVSASNRILTYINGSYMESSLRQLGNDMLLSSDWVIIGGTGFSSRSQTALFPRGIRAERIYITDEKLLSDPWLSGIFAPIVQGKEDQYQFILN